MVKHIMILLRFITVSVMLSLSFSVSSEEHPFHKRLILIEDRGGIPIDQYFPSKRSIAEQIKKAAKDRGTVKLVNAHFPVVTKSMAVGPVTDEEASNIHYQMASRPMFIIGYDPVSIDWLKKNKLLLNEKKAIGLVVNVDTKEQMEKLQAIAGDTVFMQPTPGDRLAEHLKIRHYPFYMDSKGVMR